MRRRRDPREVLTRAAPPPRLTVAYGPLPDQVADVWLPAGPGRGFDGARHEFRGGAPDVSPGVPLAVIVHGGFWRAEYDRRHTRPQCAGLAAAGYAVAAIEYRRIGAGGGWPATFDDVALALDTVPALVASAVAERYGQIVDTARVVHVGHSAGAHLAVWAASRHRLRPGSRWHVADGTARPTGVVSLAGVLDLAAAARLDLDHSAALELLGGDPDIRARRYAVTDPMRLIPPASPVVLLHGADDRHVPPSFSRRYAAATGAPLTELRRVEHFALIDPKSRAWPAVLDAVTTALA
ncbi:alpha/beta hydrolase [Jiangella anatolica]|uniref:Alpha/beta hydrolase n=1 Tax=Jiangella anatolica TaxID=2670374 RepID=A0A2W2BDS3_9ACTN|nr:alpha/beta hydrolase fold domain-containing protein [Jiangella anatolica]PZF84132.1 alpha/beta hydrolase [Jiangella anatolica]